MSREKRAERRRPQPPSGDRMTDRTPLVLGTHHVAVICSDYERSKHFYVVVLGLEVRGELARRKATHPRTALPACKPLWKSCSRQYLACPYGLTHLAPTRR